MPYFNQHDIASVTSPYEVHTPIISSSAVFDGTYYIHYTLKNAIDGVRLFKVDITDMSTSNNIPSSEYSDVEVTMVNTWEWDNQIHSQTDIILFTDKDNMMFDLA